MMSSGKILIVDDDPRLCRTLSRYLALEGFTVNTAASSSEMRQCMSDAMPDLVILDLRLSGEDGLNIAREIRAEYDVAIVILTGKSDIVDRVVGLEIGADDYVTKPFDERELLARVRSVLRRTSRATAKPARGNEHRVAHFKGWTLDFAEQELISPESESIRLTNFEFKLLATLVRNPNRVLNRDQIMDNIAGREWMPLDRSIDVLVRKLRRKLRDDAQNPQFIKTIRRTGYKFTAQVEFE